MSYCRTSCDHGRSDVYLIRSGSLYEIMVACLVEHKVRDKSLIGACLFSGSPGECVRQLVMLKRKGFVVPQHAILRLLDERREEDITRLQRKVKQLRKAAWGFRPLYRLPAYRDGRYS